MDKKSIAVIFIVTMCFLGLIQLPLESILIDWGYSRIQSKLIEEFIQNLIVIGLGLVAIRSLNAQKLAGLSGQLKWENPIYVAIPLYLVLIGVLQLMGGENFYSGTNTMLLLISSLSIGFSE
ncbi:MAG: hypothetical protein AAF391_00945 [Bacteroidota bacterium]